MTKSIQLGIFGFPVAQSKSPEMHDAAAKALGIALEYHRFEVSPDDLATVVHEKHGERIDGYNLTVPHKRAIMPLLDEVTADARAIGAVNTVVRTDDRYVGHNTDAPGFVRSLREANVPLEDARVVVVGAGGAARAGVVGLAEAGAAEITVLARRPEQAESLVEGLAEHVECPLEAAALSDASWHLDSATLLVQATSATLESNPHRVEFAAALPIEAMPADATVVDMVYKPRVTTVMARADEHGLRTVDGLGMLLHQGAIAFEMWTGSAPPLDVMKTALGV